MNATEAEVDTKLLPCPLCGMHLRAAVDPRLSGMLEHPPHVHCPISAVAFLDRADLRAAWNRRPALSTLQVQTSEAVAKTISDAELEKIRTADYRSIYGIREVGLIAEELTEYRRLASPPVSSERREGP